MIPLNAPKKIQPIANTNPVTNVATERTPSRDSQDERHCENARHARSGRPRWNTEERRPTAASPKALAKAATPNQGLTGSRPSGTPRPSSSNSPNPAPEAVVKKTIDRAGCMLSQRDSSLSTQRNRPLVGVTGSGSAAAAAKSGAFRLRRGGRYLLTGRYPSSGIRSVPARAATSSDTAEA